MHALLESFHLTAAVDGFALSFDVRDATVEIAAGSDVVLRERFYARRGLSNLAASTNTVHRLEDALYASVLRAVDVVRPLATADGAGGDVRRAYSTLGSLSPAARLHQLRSTRPSRRVA